MIKKSQVNQAPQTLDTVKLIQNDQSLDSRIAALEKAVDLLMKHYQGIEENGVINDQS